MAIRITEDGRMTSDQTTVTARRWSPADAAGDEVWTSDRCPSRALSRSQAITSLVLAEIEMVAPDSARAAGFRAELGL